ncbi:AAA family ATPase [Aeromonas hydrophila]
MVENMNFNVEIKNFGKIKKANLKISPFTVIAGSNSSGKSFITKALYSFFSTINKDHVTVEVTQTILRIIATFNRAKYSITNPSQAVHDLLDEFFSSIYALEQTIHHEYGECTYTEQYSRAYLVKDRLESINSVTTRIFNEIDDKKKYASLKEAMSVIQRNIKIIDGIVAKPNNVLSSQIEDGFKNALKENFQVQSLSELRNYMTTDDSRISFDFEQLGSISIDGESIDFRLDTHSVDEFQRLYNVVFLESPIYWKLKQSLESVRDQRHISRYMNVKRRNALLGVPKHFYDLVDLVNEKIKLEDGSKNIDLYAEINSAIGGELDISDTGEMFFKEKDCPKHIGISATATGITNLGIISLLLKRNVISEGSFIFVDEPEVNLHPAWQSVMIESLYKLSRNGINVVIATHSIDMMKYIENIVDSITDKDDIDNHFAINELSSNGVSDGNGKSIPQKISSIKSALGDSFYNMSLESWL